MIGETVSHYQILEKLGEGGMGVVYKAEDTQLKRPVVLKFLSPELTRDPEAKKRFVYEAQAASALDHPNICTIHEIDETEDGQLFMVMAYYEGQTLKQTIAQGLSVDAMVEMARHIAQGLIAAHEKGIIHRDIKPANVMITPDGMAKILDFGVAKLAGQGGMTRTGMTAGTVAYMSPEQARGEEVDPRTDIWSLGVVLYEMVTGQLPFKGEYDQAVVYSIINEEPEPPITLRPDLPAFIETVIHKSVEKDKTRRYQNMQELLQDLQASFISPVALSTKGKSIVVLPFENMSPDPDQEYFSDGLTEEIITDLSQIHDLIVISRSSAMTLKGTKKKIREIAKEVNVRYVLEGSVRKAGNNLRITAQLIDAANDAHLWAEKYSGTLDDVFDIQEKVSRSIVDALKLKLSPEEDAEIAERPIMDTQAYDIFLRARHESLIFTEEGLERALQLISNGLKIIGDNELLYEAMGYTYFQYFNTGLKKEVSFLQKVEECVKKIIALNPNSYIRHFLRALLHWKQGNIPKAIRDYKSALELNPKHVDSLMLISWLFTISGKSYAAKTRLNRLIEIAPLDWLTHFAAGWVEFAEGKFEIGLKSLLKAYKLDPENQICRLWYAHGLTYDHKFEEAYKLFDLIVKESPEMWIPQFSLFFKYALQNKKTKALQSVSKELRHAVQRDEIMPLLMAECYALIDEKDEAIDWLEEVVKWGFINYPFLNEHDPHLENIRGEERFKKLMERVKYEWENFEV